jgi:hypothetical protein
MLAFMKYENGLNFKGVIFENENAAKLWLKQNKISNPDCYELVEVEFIKEDLKALKRMELEEELKKAKDNVRWFKKVSNDFEEKDFSESIEKWTLECERLQKEIDNL